MKIERVTLSAKEAADYLGSAYWRITEQAKQGKIPHTRIDGKLIFRKGTQEQFIDEKEIESSKH